MASHFTKAVKGNEHVHVNTFFKPRIDAETCHTPPQQQQQQQQHYHYYYYYNHHDCFYFYPPRPQTLQSVVALGFH
jgi:hypothetical protein